MFALGKELPFDYLLALDADVILHPGILKKIAAEAKNCEFFLDFFVMDKFRGRCCSGCHLYLNKYSDAASKNLYKSIKDRLDTLAKQFC